MKSLSSSERSPESEVIEMSDLTRVQETLKPDESTLKSEVSKESLPKHKERKFGKIFRKKKKESLKSSDVSPESEAPLRDSQLEKTLRSSEVSEER